MESFWWEDGSFTGKLAKGSMNNCY